MDFELNEEQVLLREQARAFLSERCPPDTVRAVLDSESRLDRGLWKAIAELGWLATVIPEEYGGLGLSHVELCVIAEELGRAVAPVPFSSSVYFATEALLAAGTAEQKERWLPRLAAGDAFGTFALSERPGRLSPSAIAATFENGQLAGVKRAVPDGFDADIALVLAKSSVGPVLVLVDLDQSSVSREEVGTIDPSRGHATLSFDNARAELVGAAGEGWDLLERLLDRSAVLFAWEQLGGAEDALEQAKAYACERYAFGRPIGSFQAIQHKLVNIFVKNSIARSNCYFAAWALSDDAAELPAAAAAAKLAATQAYRFAAQENLQTHGGVGYTWEFDCQFHYRRARILGLTTGSEAHWQDKLMSAIDQNESVLRPGGGHAF